MKDLYIIGNGFDLHHHLDTSYRSFGLFLKERHTKIYDLLIEHFGMPVLDKNNPDSGWGQEWLSFENSLAELDFDGVLEEYRDYIGNPATEEFSDGDWHSYQIELEGVVKNLTENLVESFKEFILNVKRPSDINKYRLKLNKNATFLNFNYTDTLEYLYSVDPKNIVYIHHKATSTNKLILGHGIEPASFQKPAEKPPAGLNDEQLLQWQERMADAFDYSYAAGKDALAQYFFKSFKQTARVIQDNQSFFANCSGIEKITILGHSLSEVDWPYIEKIISSISPDALWSVSFYKDGEGDAHVATLVSLGLEKSKITTFKMEALKV